MKRQPEFPKIQAEELIRENTELRGPFRWESLHSDGSERVFFRVTSQKSSLVVVWSPLEDDHFPNENDSYVYMGKHLRQKGIPVPQIYAYARPEGMTLVEDLGSVHLQEAASSNKGELFNLYRRAVDLLVKMQVRATEGLDTNYCYDTPVYDPPFIVKRELEYFQQSFLLEGLGLSSDSYNLDRDFSSLALQAGAREDQLFFLHRDFQSRNLMLKGDLLYAIDFQGARLGPPQYDLAALLLDPYVQLSESIQKDLLTAYSKQFSKLVGVSSKEFLGKYPHVALCRNLQVLAAFAFLTRAKGRAHFARYIVPAWQQLQRILAAPPCSDYRGLAQLVRAQSEEVIAQTAAKLEREARKSAGRRQQAADRAITE